MTHFFLVVYLLTYLHAIVRFGLRVHELLDDESRVGHGTSILIGDLGLPPAPASEVVGFSEAGVCLLEKAIKGINSALDHFVVQYYP